MYQIRYVLLRTKEYTGYKSLHFPWFPFQPLEYNYPGYPTGYFYPGVPTNSSVAVPPSTQTYQLVDVPHTATGKLKICPQIFSFILLFLSQKKQNKKTKKKKEKKHAIKRICQKKEVESIE